MPIKAVPVDILLDYVRKNKKLYSIERQLRAKDDSPASLKTKAYCTGAHDQLDELECLLMIAAKDLGIN